ncbi:CHASE2 domain-containing protein [Chitinibacter tainanensis]|uniref:CHASE2 domain-containing protein n=1 Tax=Chitinibacter tainanensis TaxID=230667 RepID=UPI0023528B2B|nr:adenylate/guanylate cyclase domain-containing protein [Chitinibacter tainanensis]
MLRRLSFFSLFFLLAALLVTDLAGLQLTRRLDWQLGDWLLRQHSATRAASSDVVIVDIDQKSLEEMNEVASKWPWPRSVHAELIDYLAAQQPAAIVFDIMFNEPDTFGTESDALLRDTASQYPNLYFAQTRLEDGTPQLLAKLPASVGLRRTAQAASDAAAVLLLPTVLAPEAWRGGLINFAADDDGIGRHYLFYDAVAGWQLPSLPYRLALDQHWLAPEQPLPPRFRLNWQQAHPHISYSSLYQAANSANNPRPANEFRGKIVLIGTAAPGLQDLRPTPLSQSYPGVEILATAIDNLRHGDWLRDSPRWPLIGAGLLIMGILLYGFHNKTNTLILGGGMLAITLFAILLSRWALSQQLYLPVAGPLVWSWTYFWLAALMAYLAEKASREQAIAMFSRFLDSRVVGELIANGQINVGQKAQSREVSVLFSDIRGFTTLSESQSPEFMVELLNRYFSRQVAVIFKHGGTLDKFIGDAIMAFWGAPVDDPRHAERAIAAALDMSRELDIFKQELAAQGAQFNVEAFDIGIGIHTGPAVVGFIGADSRLDYTAIGDTVNLASRIEGLTKGVSRILVSNDTQIACTASGSQAYDFINQGTHSVKGREQAVTLFEPQVKA